MSKLKTKLLKNIKHLEDGLDVAVKEFEEFNELPNSQFFPQVLHRYRFNCFLVKVLWSITDFEVMKQQVKESTDEELKDYLDSRLLFACSKVASGYKEIHELESLVVYLQDLVKLTRED